MTRPSKPRREHPAEAHARQQIALAICFTAHFRKSPHEAYTEQTETLAAARMAAAAMNTAHGKFGRRAGVYAVSPSGARYFVPDDYQDDG